MPLPPSLLEYPILDLSREEPVPAFERDRTEAACPSISTLCIFLPSLRAAKTGGIWHSPLSVDMIPSLLTSSEPPDVLPISWMPIAQIKNKPRLFSWYAVTHNHSSKASIFNGAIIVVCAHAVKLFFCNTNTCVISGVRYNTQIMKTAIQHKQQRNVTAITAGASMLRGWFTKNNDGGLVCGSGGE